jgi:DCN1-like protein 4/5
MEADEEPTPAPKKQKTGLGKPPKYTKTRLKSYFAKYKDEDDQISPEGMGKLCDDAQVDPEDVAMLVLGTGELSRLNCDVQLIFLCFSTAWKIGAKRMGYFSEDEFMQGFDKLKIDCQEALHNSMDTLRAELPKARPEIYKFAFDFGKDSAEKKTLELDIVVGLLKLLLPDNPHTSKFVSFLEKQTAYRGMSADHWKMWYEFAHSVGADFKEYDALAAWPSIIDEYVEHYQRESN